MNAKPEKFEDPSVGILDIRSKGNNEYVFVHLTSWLTGKEALKLEEAGLWLIRAAQYLKQSKLKSGSHRDS